MRQPPRREYFHPMGGHPYYYFVPYTPDPLVALRDLRDREFQAGRYYPAKMFPVFPVNSDSPAPGKKHASIDAARIAAAETGTRSILDLLDVTKEEEFCAAQRLAAPKLLELFGTTQPNYAAVAASTEVFDMIPRGMGVCLVVWEDGEPREWFFAGYSFD